MIYPISKFILSMVLPFYLKKTKGKFNIPKTNFIAAANHASYTDDVILPYILSKYTKRKFHIFVNSRFYKNRFLKALLYHYELIPVDVAKDITDSKKRKATNEAAFRKAMDYIKKGNDFFIFPEGGRSKDGKIKKAKTGIAKIALESHLPVLPVGIKDSYEILPKGAKFPRFKKAEVIIGRPLYFDKYYGKEKDYKTLEKVTTIIMKEIAELTDQKYDY
jgi:1-acyl-sn-glycerol-3-phosphate acyltransferase